MISLQFSNNNLASEATLQAQRVRRDPQEGLCRPQTAVVLLLCDLEGLLPLPPFRAFTPVSPTSLCLGSSSQVIN